MTPTTTMPPLAATLPPPSGTVDWTLPIEGMTCASCVARVEKALRTVPGVVTAEVNLATEQALVTVAGAQAKPEALVAAVQKAGYVSHGATPAGSEPALAPDHPHDTTWWPIALGAALVAAAGVSLTTMFGICLTTIWREQHIHLPARVREFDRVPGEVDKDLLQTLRIAQQIWRQCIRHRNIQRYIFLYSSCSQ